MAGKGARVVKSVYQHWNRFSDRELARALLDFETWCAVGKIIINKQGHAVPLILNEAQKEVAKLVLPKVFAPIPEPVTLCIHKSRQMGISVILAALEQYCVSRKKNINLVHIMPDEDSANMFYTTKWLPLLEATHPQLLPDSIATTSPVPYVKTRDFLNHNMGCNTKIGGSLSGAAGRGSTQHIVILDEYAYYEKTSNLERGLLATQPKTGMVLTIYVSTANGMNGFYDIVQQAKSPGSRIGFLFLPWHMLEEYERTPDVNSRFYNLDNYRPTEYDMKLMGVFEECGYPRNSWIKKLAFYDWVLDGEAHGDQDYMFENYPSTEYESFEATGRPVLPAKAINFWLKQDHPFKYIAQFADESARNTVKVVMLETHKSAIKQYTPPLQGHRYALWCDPSSGDYAGDRSAGVVVDLATLEEVCSFADYIEQTEMAEMLVNLARYYNNAQIVIERNMGQVAIEWIKQIGYPRLYVDPTATNNRFIQYGVRTTQATKEAGVKRLKFLLNKGLYKPHDVLFLQEAQHFSYRQLPGGGWRMEATGTNDDGRPWGDDTILARVCGVMTLNMRKYKEWMEPEKRSKGIA